MKTRYKIIGILALAFGLINIFWYTPYSLALVFMNQPFHFQHLQNIEVYDGGGIGTQILYLPFEAIQSDPYWLIWSLSLYFGIVILSVLGVGSLRQKHE
ncbi:MAG TPA: hypothetical protein VGA92_03340 [Candidatus Nitrosotenuis sp.]|jgi:hypothetical protein